MGKQNQKHKLLLGIVLVVLATIGIGCKLYLNRLDQQYIEPRQILTKEMSIKLYDENDPSFLKENLNDEEKNLDYYTDEVLDLDIRFRERFLGSYLISKLEKKYKKENEEMSAVLLEGMTKDTIEGFLNQLFEGAPIIVGQKVNTEATLKKTFDKNIYKQSDEMMKEFIKDDNWKKQVSLLLNKVDSGN